MRARWLSRWRGHVIHVAEHAARSHSSTLTRGMDVGAWSGCVERAAGGILDGNRGTDVGTWPGSAVRVESRRGLVERTPEVAWQDVERNGVCAYTPTHFTMLLSVIHPMSTSPNPVIEYVASVSAITYTALSPVTEYVAPAPVVTYAATSWDIDYVSHSN